MFRVLLLIIFLAVGRTSIAQLKGVENPEACFAAIIVSDIDTAIAWYTGMLGFEVVNQNHLPQRGLRQANLKSGTTALELIELQQVIFTNEILAQKPPGTRIGGFFKFGFKVSKLHRWVRYLKKAGVQLQGDVVVDPVSGGKTVVVLDPDGNRIQLFER